MLSKNITKFQGNQGKKKTRESSSKRAASYTSMELGMYQIIRLPGYMQNSFLFTGMGSHEFRHKFCVNVS